MKAEEEVPNRQDYPNKKRQNKLLKGMLSIPFAEVEGFSGINKID